MQEAEATEWLVKEVASRVTTMMRKGSTEPECSGMTQGFGTKGLEIWEAT